MKKQASLSFLKDLNSSFDLDVGFQINNTMAPREYCHQTEYFRVASTHFDSGNIKQDCYQICG